MSGWIFNCKITGVSAGRGSKEVLIRFETTDYDSSDLVNEMKLWKKLNPTGLTASGINNLVTVAVGALVNERKCEIEVDNIVPNMGVSTFGDIMSIRVL
jgi:hypothetical protein